MEIFLTLLAKLLPLYALIIVGYLSGKFFKVKKEFIASILIYGIIPVVTFTSVASTQLTVGTLSIPILFFLISSFISIVSLWSAGFFWKDTTKHILAYIAGSANSGYFGLPVAIALYGTNAISIVALAVLGTSLYNNSIGFFLAAKGHHTTKESLVKIVKLPMLYAFFLGILAHNLAFNLAPYSIVTNFFTDAFTVLGMMLIGVALADMRKFVFDFSFIGFTLLAKFLTWPLVMLGVISLDRSFFHLFNSFTYSIFMLLAIVPVAANMVSYATILKIHPEKTSMAVLISTLAALVYIPLYIYLFY